LALLQPRSLNEIGVTAAVATHRPEIMVVAAYGLLVPKAMLDVPRLGCVNVHASLLPRWRGAAPIQRALLAGDGTTGITIMQMDEGLDTGAILLQEALPIFPEDTAQTLHGRLAALGARLVVQVLAASFSPRPQDAARATYAEKIDPRETRINWAECAESIERKVRALNPIPGARTSLEGALLKIWRGRLERGISAPPGEVCESGAAGIVVACGADGLRLLELQRAGGKRLPVGAFVAGFNVARGARLD
jgi:methionyl-tRNA formyltransferase